MGVCSNCGVVKLAWKMDRGKRRPHCYVAVKASRHSDRPSPSRWHLVEGSHGLTTAEARELRDGKTCAICGTQDDLVIDHDHVTREIRGVLCRKCNVGLGLFAEDVVRLRAAINYLESHNCDALGAL